MPFRAPPIPLTQMNARQQATYFAQAGIQATGGEVQTFTPMWTGFSVDPTGDISYIDFGAFVVMWTTAALAGTSDATSMIITNLPSEIEPSGYMLVPCKVASAGGVIYTGAANLQGGTNDISFAIDEVSGSNILSNSIGFSAAGTKGLPDGWIIVYPK